MGSVINIKGDKQLTICKKTEKRMAGLYIHIPFCRSRCSYCAFYSTTQPALKQRYVDAVCKEMALRPHPLVAGQRIDTVYLGGGTPSTLSADQLRQLFSHLAARYELNFGGDDRQGMSPREVTIEVNPDDVSEALARLLAELPVNRVSMGAQTFDDERLRFLRRRHTSVQVSQAVNRLREAGISNISVDLMYGFPGETFDDWLRDIDRALALDVPHLSAYCLTVEEGTPLYQWMADKGTRMMDEERERQMYYALIDRLTAAGYEHYELSNFARPGMRSQHNSSYWCDVPYIGLGAAAHSYMLDERRWNVSNIRRYIHAIEHDTVPCEGETLDDDTRYNDRVTVALRTREGLNLTTLSDRHRQYCLREARHFVDAGLLRLADNRLILTREGLFVSDMVMSSLMLV